MRLTIPTEVTEVRERSVFVNEGECASFAVPIRFGVHCELPASPGRYLMLLRQRHNARLNRPWKWGRLVRET
jgi:hypothetical protein